MPSFYQTENDRLLTELQAEIETLRQEVVRQQARLTQLLASPSSRRDNPAELDSAKTTRRRALLSLSASILAGLSAGALMLPGEAQAKFVASKGTGAIVMLANGSVSNNLPASAVYGLITTPDTNLDLSKVPAGVKAGMLAYSSQAGVTGFYAETTSGNAIIGDSSDGNGVNGYSANNNGLYGYSSGAGNWCAPKKHYHSN